VHLFRRASAQRRLAVDFQVGHVLVLLYWIPVAMGLYEGSSCSCEALKQKLLGCVELVQGIGLSESEAKLFSQWLQDLE